MADFYQWDNQDLMLAVYIQPRARKTEIVGIHANRLKIRIAAPPVDGKANQVLVKFLAKTFAVSQSQVTLLHGATGREKRFKIQQPKQLLDCIHV